MQHAILAARTLVTHSCGVDERAALLGRIGASYGLGFALGPAVGGLLSSISLPATAWAAAGGSILAMVLVKVGLPEGEGGGGGEGAVASAAFGILCCHIPAQLRSHSLHQLCASVP
jgi:MFS family permease